MDDHDGQRRHPRFVLSALVALSSPDYEEYTETHSFEAVNLSQSGLLLSGRPRSCKIGVVLAVSLPTAVAGTDEMIELTGTVVRLDEKDGFAVKFKEPSQEVALKLATLISQLAC